MQLKVKTRSKTKLVVIFLIGLFLVGGLAWGFVPMPRKITITHKGKELSDYSYAKAFSNKYFSNKKAGCYLSIEGKAILLSDKKDTDCGSIFVANRYAGRKIFFRLLTSLEYTGFTEKDILNTKNELKVYRVINFKITDVFAGLEKSFEANTCKEIKYFGVPLSCFNKITGQKPDNLKYIIKYFTILKYTNNLEHQNQLVGKMVKPFDFILNSGVKYYDASYPNFYGESLESTKCTEDKGDANYQDGKVYVCSKILKKMNPNKEIRYAATMYHEANHLHQEGHSFYHTEDMNEDMDTDTLLSLNIKNSCKKTNTYMPRRRDWDFNSVNGAHINYLFSISENSLVECQSRIFAFKEAEEKMKLKLCQFPNKPYHNHQKPDCN